MIVTMKMILTLLISILTFNSFASGIQGRKSNYYYLELVPKEKFVLTFQADKICSNNTDQIRVDEFDSSTSYPSIERKGNAPVRIKSIFVESFSICSNNPIGKLERKVIIGPYKDKITHIRITASDGVKVYMANDCGMIPPGTSFDINCKAIPVTPPKSKK